MTAIFLSHSSADPDSTAKLHAALEADGHRVFFDAHPTVGIAAGALWEQTLYAKLRACRAVVFLCTEHSLKSMWCFAELISARSLGKPIFPVCIGPCDVDASPFGIITDRQFVDLATPDGSAKLRAALKDLDQAFAWDGHRPPYPGLHPFQEADAALFFGRRDEVRAAVGRLSGLRRSGAARLMLVLGASGSGKSSFVRAGLVPHLRADAGDWVIVPPFRPSEGLGDPRENLAAALAEAWSGHDQAPTADQMRTTLATPGPPHPWLRATRDLALATGRRDATVLLVIDQFEELLAAPGASPFLDALCDALAASQALPSCPLIVVATLRSDYLTAFQGLERFAAVETAEHLIKPIPAGRFGELIEGPAEVVGLELQPGLAGRVVDDAATDDALPLLAFTMAELHQRGGDDGRLTLDEYDALGGIAGSVRKVVEQELAAAGFGAEQEAALHQAFVPHLVQIGEEDQYRRRRARRDELPPAALPLLDRLVDARLLARDGDAYEVVHESLFRVWDRLAAWLTEDRQLLAWQRRAADTAHWWMAGGRDEGALLRGAALAEAQRWMSGHGENLGPELRAFFEASVALHEREERARAEQADRLRRRVLATEARELTLSAEAMIAEDLQLSLLLGVEAAQRSLDADGEIAPVVASLLQRAVLGTVPRIALGGGAIETVAWHPDGRRLATGSADGHVCVIDTETGDVLHELGDLDWVDTVAWSGDGIWLAAGDRDGKVTIWAPTDDRRQPPLTGDGAVQSVHWRAADPVLAVGRALGPPSVVEIHHLDARGAPQAVPGIRGTWSPDGALLATGGFEGRLRLFTADCSPIADLPGHDRYVHALAWTADGRRLATASVDDTAIVWDVPGRARLRTLEAKFALGAAWAPDGSLLAASSGDRLVSVWDGNTYEPRFTMAAAGTITGDAIAGTGASGYVVSIAWSPDGRCLAASDRGGQDGGEVHLLDADLLRAQTAEDVLSAARRQVRRTLTDDERRRYLGP